MEFTRPHDLDEALEAKAATPSAELLAGGTDLMVEVNLAHHRPGSIISLSRISQLKEWDERRIGAGVTWQRLESASHRALAQLARTIGSPQIRNAGTIGGNIGTASPAGDGLPWLAALDAGIEVASSSRGNRVVAWNEFFTGVKQTALEPDEIITAAVLPPDVPARQEFAKVGIRSAMVISTVAAVVVQHEDGRGAHRVRIGRTDPDSGLRRRGDDLGRDPGHRRQRWPNLPDWCPLKCDLSPTIDRPKSIAATLQVS